MFARDARARVCMCACVRACVRVGDCMWAVSRGCKNGNLTAPSRLPICRPDQQPCRRPFAEHPPRRATFAEHPPRRAPATPEGLRTGLHATADSRQARAKCPTARGWATGKILVSCRGGRARLFRPGLGVSVPKLDGTVEPGSLELSGFLEHPALLCSTELDSGETVLLFSLLALRVTCPAAGPGKTSYADACTPSTYGSSQTRQGRSQDLSPLPWMWVSCPSADVPVWHPPLTLSHCSSSGLEGRHQFPGRGRSSCWLRWLSVGGSTAGHRPPPPAVPLKPLPGVRTLPFCPPLPFSCQSAASAAATAAAPGCGECRYFRVTVTWRRALMSPRAPLLPRVVARLSVPACCFF